MNLVLCWATNWLLSRGMRHSSMSPVPRHTTLNTANVFTITQDAHHVLQYIMPFDGTYRTCRITSTQSDIFTFDVSVATRDLHQKNAVQFFHVIKWPAAGESDKVLDGSKRQYIFRKRDDDPWTGTTAARRWATRTTDFLPRRISVVPRTGRRTEQASSDEHLWQSKKHQR